MNTEALSMEGAWRIDLAVHGDPRGYFSEWFREETASELLNRPWQTAQANVSRSGRGVVRGIHYALVPPGQAKWVTCLDGAIIDFIIDLREGSPTFLQHDAVVLEAGAGTAVLIGEGLGHAFVATSQFATVSYLVNQAFNPQRELPINPLDPEIGLDFGDLELVLSEKDKAAPSLAAARAAGNLPTMAQWRALNS